MFEQLVSQKNNLAHAYVCVGDREKNQHDIKRFIADGLGIEIVANPNLYIHEYTNMGIADVRTITEQQLKTSVGVGTRKIFIISFATVTIEAQNAMLKTLEEPSEDTLLFLLTGAVTSLLPTIMSRSQLLVGEHTEVYSDLIEEFVAGSFVEREKIFQQFLGDSKKNIPANKSGADQFITELLSHIHSEKKEGWIELYREVEEVKKYCMDRSSSLKYIFEYISIRLF